jgi:hypothetical protein
MWCSVSAGKFLPFKENKVNPEKQRVLFSLSSFHVTFVSEPFFHA